MTSSDWALLSKLGIRSRARRWFNLPVVIVVRRVLELGLSGLLIVSSISKIINPYEFLNAIVGYQILGHGGFGVGGRFALSSTAGGMLLAIEILSVRSEFACGPSIVRFYHRAIFSTDPRAAD